LPGSVAIPKSEVRGWEADLTWQPTDGLHLTAAVNWVDSEIESDPPLPIDPYGTLTTFIGERSPYTPEWQATTGGEYEFTVGTMRWSLGAGLNYRSDSYSNFGENAMFLLDERVLVDVRVGRVGPAGNWRVQLYGRKRYGRTPLHSDVSLDRYGRQLHRHAAHLRHPVLVPTLIERSSRRPSTQGLRSPIQLRSLANGV
jgi:outer membrane receptor protein involved in Fe transport